MDPKPILMIHEVSEEMFDLPLRDYVLTFDDGLYTQYKYRDKIAKIHTEKLFFITSKTVCYGAQSEEYITCRDAHKKAFETGNTENYMTLDQIRELASYPDVTIGGHGYAHVDIEPLSFVDKIEYIKEDTKLMFEWFDQNLWMRPNHFCFPHNNNISGIYNALLITYGVTHFYGKERIPVESLLRKD